MAPLCGRAVLERGELLSDPLCGDRDVLAVGGGIEPAARARRMRQRHDRRAAELEAFADALREAAESLLPRCLQERVAFRLFYDNRNRRSPTGEDERASMTSPSPRASRPGLCL